MQPPFLRVPRALWRGDDVSEGERAVPEEVAVALTYDGSTQAVMMATPADLEDFAIGFSLSEGIVADPSEIERLEIVEAEIGVELRMWLAVPRAEALASRRRYLAGPTGCGLCGMESLTEAVRRLPSVEGGVRFAEADIRAALEALAPLQVLNRETRSMHAAAFAVPGEGVVALREDVGRHNALDKLCGALARAGLDAASGMVLLTSRVSVEMVQKTALLGAPLIVAVSAPTALAVRTAEAAGITLVAIARGDAFEVFTHPHRIAQDTHVV
ncbi:sulfurtransferase FdhD [Kaistia sp. 32K]|uniref:formate dehydrogenase accessory sulfurtransferase FdhD n=1 Tax=Kaistia sp. 32K TaxID=2795690 RepID=UPI001915F659|nr:formate dehydrogenase accessory sulfurtransferase FdhD [Kaistia sp. 32K]BCP53423.1 sulfurtransferase FdhD [Kaistia sp. 32K]